MTRVFYRLDQGQMTINGLSGTPYDVSTSYNAAGGITSKTSSASNSSSTLSATSQSMSYDLSYQYSAAKPHQLSSVEDHVSGQIMQFTYNGSGSIKEIQGVGADGEEFFWNEDQWLNAVRNDQGIHHYVYDHSGERIMKSSLLQTQVTVNDNPINDIVELEPYTLYVNPYFVVTEFGNADKVSKHYFMGSQRVASEVDVQMFNQGYSPYVRSDDDQASEEPSSDNPWLDNLNAALTDFDKVELSEESIEQDLPPIESVYPDLVPQATGLMKTSASTSASRITYWYHPDYVGNVDLVTDGSGTAYEFFLYNPWGENLYEWNSGTTSWNSPYRFNSKELDQETGFHYYGARYHHPKLSMWLSVDPLAHETIEPYVFTGSNPICKKDQNGLFWEEMLNWISGDGWKSNEAVAFGQSHPNWSWDKKSKTYSNVIHEQYANDGSSPIELSTVELSPKFNAVNDIFMPIERFAYYTGLFPVEFGLGVSDFISNYYDMLTANWLLSDKYFHSKANFEATRRGGGGEFAAEKISNLREIVDQLLGDTRQDAISDQEANRYGRDQADLYKGIDKKYINFKDAIPRYRPKSLPDKY